MSLRKSKGVPYLGLGWALRHDCLGEVTPHAHHAVKICLARKSNIMVDLGESTFWASTVLIRSGMRHAVRNEDERIYSFYIDPDCEAAEGLTKLVATVGSVSLSGSIEHGVRKCVRRIIASSLHAQQAFEEFSMLLGSPKTGRVCDPRVATALAELSDSHRNPWPLADLAQSVGLSQTRFATIFKESTGLPVRTHVRWLRIQTTVRALSIGADPTTAARAAGYSSATQCRNHFRHMFGVSQLAFMAAKRKKT